MRLILLRRRFLTLLGFTALHATGAAFAAGEGLPSMEASRRVVILGDSITAGYGLERAQAYPAILQNKVRQAGFNFEVVAAGVSGDTTAGGLRRVRWALGQGVAVFVVALGGNDGLRGIPPSEMEKNLSEIVKAVRTLSPKAVVVIAGMRMPDNLGATYVKAFESVFPSVSSNHETVLLPFLLEGVGGIPKFNQPDMIHPNAEGHERIAANVWTVLEPILRQISSRTP